jgi:hypothetical protein
MHLGLDLELFDEIVFARPRHAKVVLGI